MKAFSAAIILLLPLLSSAYPDVFKSARYHGLAARQSADSCPIADWRPCAPWNPYGPNPPPRGSPDYETKAREWNNAHYRSCSGPNDCTSFCQDRFADDPTAVTYGVLNTCSQNVCSCSAAGAQLVSEILIGIGEVACVAVNEAIPQAAAVLSFIVPYAGEAAAGAKGLFKAGKKVFKKGSKDCGNVCPGHEYTVVDPKDIATQLGILDCGMDS